MRACRQAAQHDLGQTTWNDGGCLGETQGRAIEHDSSASDLALERQNQQQSEAL